MTTSVHTSQRLAERRRERLRDLMDRLEAALAEPGHGPGWLDRLGGITEELHIVVDDHVVATEGPDGLFDEVLLRSPRLRRDVDALRHDHPRLQRALATLSAEIASARPDDVRIEAIRELGSQLLVDLIRHRQRGADLLYEAYWVDVEPTD